MSAPQQPLAPAEPPQRHLVARYADLSSWLKVCPFAQCLTGYAWEDHQRVLLQLRCRTWGCAHCGPRRIRHLAHKVSEAQPNRLLTLTIDPALWDSPREAYDGTRRHVSTLMRRIRSTYGHAEYLRVLEVTRKGWPHYHVLLRSPYVPWKWVRSEWHSLTGARIVDLRQCNKTWEAAVYLTKYLAKQKLIPWTKRRLSWSKRFFPPPADDPPETMGLHGVHRHLDSPVDVLYYEFPMCEIEQHSNDVWIIHPPERQRSP